MEKSIRVLSEHHAIVLQLGDPNTIVLNPSTNKLNWKHADEEEFTNTLRKTIGEDRDNYDNIVSNTLHYGKQTAMPDELDRAMEYIQQLLEKVANESIPECRICSRSKPWWTPELMS